MIGTSIPLRLRRVAALASLAAATFCHADLVGHYRFDETAGTTAVNEVLSSGNDGAIGANVTRGAAGVAGTAFTFTGGAAQADIVDMADAQGVFSPVLASNQVTISYWMQSMDTGNRNVAVFMGNNALSNDYIDSGLLGSGQFAPIGTGYGRSRKATNTNVGNVGGGPVITDGNFHHIALSIDYTTTTAKFYVDGLLTDTETGAFYAALPTLNNLEVGRLGRSAPTDGLAGSIDDLQIYSSALNLREVASLFANPGSSLNDLPPIVAGDTNGDGVVDVTDFNNIRDRLGYTGLPAGLGSDIAGEDGVVDFRDLRFFQQNYPTVFALGMGVPEPASLVPVIIAAACLTAPLSRLRRDQTNH
jgi:hypothetical protein